MGNLKPAPFPLDEALTAKLVGGRPPYGKGVAHVPLLGSVNAHCVPVRHEGGVPIERGDERRERARMRAGSDSLLRAMERAGHA